MAKQVLDIALESLSQCTKLVLVLRTVYRVSPNEWPPYNTKYGPFLIVLCKSFEKISHWLSLDDSFVPSKPNQGEIF